jgi:hypothetical protein
LEWKLLTHSLGEKGKRGGNGREGNEEGLEGETHLTKTASSQKLQDRVVVALGDEHLILDRMAVPVGTGQALGG